MKTIIISQPRYLPIVNYIQRLRHADIFVFLDNVQRQARGVENRNKIIINGIPKWLTIPVSSSTRTLIKDAQIDGLKWVSKHKATIYTAYKKAPFFDERFIESYYQDIEKVLLETNFSYTETIIHLILNVCKIFGFTSNIIKATELNIPLTKGVENLFNITKAAGADIYISGSNGRKYGVKEYFEKREIKVLFNDYVHPVYLQFNTKTFVPWMCFFDTLFNIGYEETKKLIEKPLDLNL